MPYPPRRPTKIIGCYGPDWAEENPHFADSPPKSTGWQRPAALILCGCGLLGILFALNMGTTAPDSIVVNLDLQHRQTLAVIVALAAIISGVILIAATSRK